MKGAQIIIQSVIDNGVDTVFGYPGGTIIDIYDEIYKASDKLNHYITAHEQGASHAADGYARYSGKTGVVIATSGPGATNLVTGIATAALDSVPMVAITGNVGMPLIGKDTFQEVDITGVTMPITKYNIMVKDIANLQKAIYDAFKIANTGRPGPVLVDVPKDIQQKDFPYIPKDEFLATYKTEIIINNVPSDNEIKMAAKLINESERPLIFSGGGVVIAEAAKKVEALARKTDAPVMGTVMGLSALPFDYEKCLGMSGMHGTYSSARATDECDLLIALGTRFSDRSTGDKTKYAKDATVLHIDIDPAEISKNIPAQYEVVGELGYILDKLIADVDEVKRDDWGKQIAQFQEEEAQKQDEGEHLGIEIIKAIGETAGENTPIVTDVGQHQMWTAQNIKFKRPRTFLTSGGLGTMGYGMGAAIGACLASSRENTFLVIGDGGFHMNLNEMVTCVSNNLPVKIFVMNNNALGMVRQWQEIFYGKRYSSTVLNRKTNYVKLAEAFGGTGMSINCKEDIAPVIKKALETEGPVIVDCKIATDDLVLPMIPPGGTNKDIIFTRKQIEER